MAGDSLQTVIDGSLALLPNEVSRVSFDDYKSSVLAAYPESGKDALTAILKGRLLNKRLERQSDGTILLKVWAK